MQGSCGLSLSELTAFDKFQPRYAHDFEKIRFPAWFRLALQICRTILLIVHWAIYKIALQIVKHSLPTFEPRPISQQKTARRMMFGLAVVGDNRV